MMDTAEQRQHFRKRLVDLSNVELTQWSFLVGLVARIECEMLAYAALFSPSIELDPAPDTQLTGIQMLISGEIKRRSRSKAKRQKLPTIGEITHEQTGH